MQKTKIKFLVLFLLAIFVIGKSLVLFHSFSHQNPLAQNHDLEHKKDDCVLCSFASFQNQISFADFYCFAASGFMLIFALRFFNQNKLSFLLSSKSSRAPPRIS